MQKIEATIENKPVNVSQPHGCDTQADYYLENGYVVFKESYHLKRGTCCKSGCRHCPYGFSKKK